MIMSGSLSESRSQNGVFLKLRLDALKAYDQDTQTILRFLVLRGDEACMSKPNESLRRELTLPVEVRYEIHSE